MSGRYFVDHGMWHDRKTGKHLEDIVSDLAPTERLGKLLEVVADHDQTPEEARAELEADGVDVDLFLARVAYDERKWLLARAERAERRLSSLIDIIIVRDPDTGGWECMSCHRVTSYNARDALEHESTCPVLTGA